MEVKKVKLEEKSTQTETASANGTSNHSNTKSVPLLTSLPLGAANDPSKHQRRSSHISDLPSPQSVIVKLNNNNPNMVTTARPTAINKSAAVVSTLAAAAVMPSTDDTSPSKSVVFVDEVTECSAETKNQDQRAKPAAVSATNATANSNSAAISNGPAVPLNVADSTIRDVAL